MEEPTRNIALLIDADNASWHAIDPVLTVLAELGTVNIRRVYGNWSKPALKGWRDMTVKHGIEDGIPIYGFGNAKTPEAFKQACTRFIDVGALVSDAKAEATAGTTAATPKPTNVDVPIGDSLPPSIAGTPRVKKPIDPELIALLIDAYQSVKRDEKGYVSLSAMGQLAGNRSSFDTRNYGYQRLSDLIQAVPNFQSERRPDGVFVKRVR
jgi:hypothetical protein